MLDEFDINTIDLSKLSDHEKNRYNLIFAYGLNAETLLSGDEWINPNKNEVALVLNEIKLTDKEIALKLNVNERTVRKWKSGSTRMQFPTWCCLCYLAGLGCILK